MFNLKVLPESVIEAPEGKSWVECEYCHRPQVMTVFDGLLAHFCNKWCHDEWKEKGPAPYVAISDGGASLR